MAVVVPRIVMPAILVWLAGWWAPVFANQNPLPATPGLMSSELVTYVDDDAPGDPGPGNPSISDPLEDGSSAHPFDRIQEAFDQLPLICDIMVLPGIYFDDVLIPSCGCTVTGGGQASTVIHGSYITASLNPDGCSSLPRLSISDLTFEGMLVEVWRSAPEDPNRVMTAFLEGLTLINAELSIVALPASYLDQFDVHLMNVEVVDGSVNLFATGSGLDIIADSITVTAGEITLNASGGLLTATLTAVQAPTSNITLSRSGGGRQMLALTDSNIGGLVVGGDLGYFARATLSRVRFTGNGVQTHESLLDLSIRDCSFDAGGVQINAAHSPDVGTNVAVSISESEFRGSGVAFNTRFGPTFGLSGHYASMSIDSSSFVNTGVVASFSPGPMESSLDGLARLSVTNSIFQSSFTGVEVSYDLPDLTPSGAHADLHVTVANNTFDRCSTGVAAGVNAHLGGQHSAVTVIQKYAPISGQHRYKGWIPGGGSPL